MFFDDFVAKLKRTSKSNRLKKIQEPCLKQASILRAVIKEPLRLKIILDLIPEEDRFAAVTFVDYTNFLVIYDAIYHPDSFKVILESLSENDRIRFLSFKNEYPSPRHTMLHLSIIEPNLLDIVLTLIPKEDLLELMDLKSHSGANCLQLAANNSIALLKLIHLFPKDRQAQVVEEQHLIAYVCHDDRSHCRGLYTYENDPNALLTVLLLVSPERRINLALHKLDAQENTILHWLAPNKVCFPTLLEQLPKAERFKALTTRNLLQKFPMDYTDQSAQESIAQLMPENQFEELQKIIALPFSFFLFPSMPAAKRARPEDQAEVSCFI